MRICRICQIELNEQNAVILRCGNWRRICKKCRSKTVVAYQKKNIKHRRKYANQYARKTGKVKKYPCLTCTKECYKKYAKAFCSDICRFKHYVLIKPKGCWEWQGTRKRNGYGHFMVGRKDYIASRFSYEYHYGLIPDGMLVCHVCDNPPCVRPSHLWLGTNTENQLDSAQKGRSRSIKITNKEAMEIRDEYAKGEISYSKLGEKYGLTISSIHRIVKNLSWKRKDT